MQKQLEVYLEFIDERVVSNEFLLCADASVVSAVLAADCNLAYELPGDVLNAMRDSCGNDSLAEPVLLQQLCPAQKPAMQSELLLGR